MFVDRLLWWAARLFPRAHPTESRPPVLEGVPLGGAAPIGPDWPIDYARRQGTTATRAPDGGLLPGLTALRSIDLRDVPEVVQQFYLHTARFSLALQPRWRWGLRGLGGLWARGWARRWGQLELPTAAAPLTNELWDAGGLGTLWVRRYCELDGTPTSRALYVSRYDVVEGPTEPLVRIAFPVPGGAWVVLFRVTETPGGLVLTERGGRAGGAGFYLVPDRGAARYVAALREEITVVEAPEGARAEHTFRWWGLHFLTLAYELPSSEAGSAK